MTVSGSAQAFSAQVAWPGLGRTLLAGLLAFAVMIGGLALALSPDGTIPSKGQLLGTLPTSVDGGKIVATAVSDSLSGLVVDEALSTLGRGRDDASVVSGYSRDGMLSITAIAVRGVSGEDLRSALNANWLAQFPREEAIVGGKVVLPLVGPAPERAYLYTHRIVVYIVETADEKLAAEALAALP